MTASSAWAEISRREAREISQSAQIRTEALLRNVPRLRDIDALLRQDCAQRSQHQSDSEYCRCASAVTFSFWTVDPTNPVFTALENFANDPAASAEPFLDLQGPELYTPLCSRAHGR